MITADTTFKKKSTWIFLIFYEFWQYQPRMLKCKQQCRLFLNHSFCHAFFFSPQPLQYVNILYIIDFDSKLTTLCFFGNCIPQSVDWFNKSAPFHDYHPFITLPHCLVAAPLVFLFSLSFPVTNTFWSEFFSLKTV